MDNQLRLELIIAAAAAVNDPVIFLVVVASAPVVLGRSDDGDDDSVGKYVEIRRFQPRQQRAPHDRSLRDGEIDSHWDRDLE